MNFDDTLHWYGQGRFTAEDVTRATGLSERSQRELLKIGVLQAIPQAKTKTRLLSSRMVKRAAMIAPLNKCGLSLEIAGRIIYAAPLLESVMFGIIDPWDAILDPFGEIDPKTGLRAKRQDDNYRRVKWFDPAIPASTDQIDHFIDIADCRYVATSMPIGRKPIRAAGSGVYAELAEEMKEFFWWSDSIEYSERYTSADPNDPPEKLGPQWNWDRSMGPEMLKFNVKDVTEEEKQKARMSFITPVSKLSINTGLVLRQSLRRLLYIDPPPST